MRETAVLPTIKEMRYLAITCLVVATVVMTRAHAATVTVSGVQAQPMQFSMDDIKKLPAQKVRVTVDKGKDADYECVTVAALLTKAGLELGKNAMHGRRLTEYLMVHARDGYQVLLAVPEVDPELTDRPVLLCHARNGVPIPEDEGPFRLILPQEKSQARWVRQVSGFMVRADKGS